MELGETYRDLGRTADAARVMRDAVALDPRPAAYWNSLGTVLGAGGQLADAERAFAEATARDGNDPNYVFNHGVALERLGRRDEAIAQYRRAAAAGFPLARARLDQLTKGRR
jgi:protein O-GlcNAc transferase